MFAWKHFFFAAVRIGNVSPFKKTRDTVLFDQPLLDCTEREFDYVQTTIIYMSLD